MTVHFKLRKPLFKTVTIKKMLVVTSLLVVLCTTVAGCANPTPQSNGAQTVNVSDTSAIEEAETAIFAGGCFWCMEKPYDELPGVIATTSGYTGGDVENPSYQQVSRGGTGHYEALKVTYDPQQVDYETLLDVFWVNVDPLDNRGQFCDKGSQYRSAIFVASPEEEALAETSREALSSRFTQPIATEILPATTFYEAEEYHQDYYQKNPVRYKVYRAGCGRDNRLATVWGDDASGH